MVCSMKWLHQDDALPAQPKSRTWGVGRIGVDEDELDHRSWENSTASERFDATLTLSLLAWSLSHAKDAPIGLRGAAGGVRRGGG
jgi:hypothetical protein